MNGDAGILCGQCGRTKGEHRLVNYADSAASGEAALICPTAVFRDRMAGEPSVDEALARRVSAVIMRQVREGRFQP